MSPLLAATRTPEERGLRRDQVRLMVAYRSTGRLVHARFDELPKFLGPDDIVVLNTSATLPAAVDAIDEAGERWVLHFSTELSAGTWVLEPRLPDGGPLQKSARAQAGPPARLTSSDIEVRIVGPYRLSSRLFVAEIHPSFPEWSVAQWLAVNGRPIRYDYLESTPGIEQYQNVYAMEPGSAEMPSAGRPFSTGVLTRLVAQGTSMAPLVLHTGVSSLESGELPYPERVRVPASTCRRVNEARQAGGRVVAVGTTVVRALESAVAAGSGLLEPIDGWTELVVGPDHELSAADGFITGWHEPHATHRWIVEAFAGGSLLEKAYGEAARASYLLHEFGDAALFLP